MAAFVAHRRQDPFSRAIASTSDRVAPLAEAFLCFENGWNDWNIWNVWNWLRPDISEAIEPFERLERSAAVERLERFEPAPVSGLTLNF
jgi:hypothetical protein